MCELLVNVMNFLYYFSRNQHKKVLWGSQINFFHSKPTYRSDNGVTGTGIKIVDKHRMSHSIV